MPSGPYSDSKSPSQTADSGADQGAEPEIVQVRPTTANGERVLRDLAAFSTESKSGSFIGNPRKPSDRSGSSI
jgi:hypothetical protein